jgi:hypothetical protein
MGGEQERVVVMVEVVTGWEKRNQKEMGATRFKGESERGKYE